MSTLSSTQLIIAIWSPTGFDTSKFSFEISSLVAENEKVFLVELPCLGIPRLGFAANIMDRDKNTENAIRELERSEKITLQKYSKIYHNLAILSANVFATPDNPLIMNVKLDTLIRFPQKVVEQSIRLDTRIIIFECQGQICNPMTFFALQLANMVLIPINDNKDLAFTLSNLNCLVNSLQLDDKKFNIIVERDRDIVADVMRITDTTGNVCKRINVVEGDFISAAAHLLDGIVDIKKDLLLKSSNKKKTNKLFGNIW